MSERASDSVERFFRFSRKSMVALLFIVLLVGVTGIVLTTWPRQVIPLATSRGALLIPVAVAIVLGAQRARLGRRWSPQSPEVKIVMHDEFRRANLDRSARLALIVVLIAQYPLALVYGILSRLPAPQLAFGMFFSTITIGLTTLISLFLYFDRE
jgi:hypothetical protein